MLEEGGQTRRARASPPRTHLDQAEDETRHSHIAGGGVHGDQRAADARHAAQGLLRPGHPQLLRPRLPVTPHLAQHQHLLPVLAASIVLNVPKILNILEILHPLPTTCIEPIILMSSLNCAIINCYKITRTELVCFKGEVADLATNNAPLTYFNTANEDGDNNTSVLLNDGKTSSSHILQKYNYQWTECKFRKRELTAVKKHIRKFEAMDGNEHSFPCKHCTRCGVSCTNLPGLKAHNQAHPARKFLCASCGKSSICIISSSPS